MNNSYTEFATLYDRLIKGDIDYKKIASFIKGELKIKTDNIILDLACGTGNLTEELKNLGYDMIGIDLSVDMLNIAKEKNPDILYLCQDMREFELYGTVDCICCMTDSLNYITDTNDLAEIFRLVKNYLNPGGSFIFDLNTFYKLKAVLGGNTFTYDDGDVFYVWENDFDEEENICDFYLSFFVKQENGTYRRFDEEHCEKAYHISQITDLLTSAGFENINCYSDYNKSPISETSERVVFVVS